MTVAVREMRREEYPLLEEFLYEAVFRHPGERVAREVAQAYRYDYIVVHEDWDDVPDALDRAIEQVYAIITAARAKTKHNMRFLNALSASLKTGN